MRRFLIILVLMILVPYVTTMAWTGRMDGGAGSPDKRLDVTSMNGAQADGSATDGAMAPGDRVIIVEREEAQYEKSVEEYLIYVLAAQIPASFEPETLKAQAVLARTYIYGLMDGKTHIHEEELDMDALSVEQMKRLWGEAEFASTYEKLHEAVRETVGLYVLHDGTMIEPLYCYASAGTTRTRGEDYPYLKQADSPGDPSAEGYRSLPVFSYREFASRINDILDAAPITAEQLPGAIQIVERDGAGYVKQVQIGVKTYSGEEVQYALRLPSSNYSFEKMDGKIRVICKGIGHGYGFAQVGANEMAKQGMTYEALLRHYFQNIEIVGSIS